MVDLFLRISAIALLRYSFIFLQIETWALAKTDNTQVMPISPIHNKHGIGNAKYQYLLFFLADVKIFYLCRKYWFDILRLVCYDNRTVCYANYINIFDYFKLFEVFFEQVSLFQKPETFQEYVKSKQIVYLRS